MKSLDLIILDLSMPVMDGFEFLTHFNATAMEDAPKIIIFSGMELDDTLRATLESVHVGFIDKNDSDLSEKLVKWQWPLLSHSGDATRRKILTKILDRRRQRNEQRYVVPPAHTKRL